MKKGMMALILAACVCVQTVMPVLAAQCSYPEAKSVAVRSGSLENRPLTKIEIANLYQDTLATSTDFAYEEEPNLSAPYASGKLAQSNRTAALNYVNMYRIIAGLPTVTESQECSEEAQYAAVIQAAIGGGLSHYPSQPAEMDDEFYERAYEASSSSNLSAGLNRLEESITQYMEDPGDSNRTGIGHRRWLLYSKLDVVGFGGARSGLGYRTYYACKLLEHGTYSYDPAPFDYDFISWPSSGNFPVEFVRAEQAWTISLNTLKYEDADMNTVTVTVTNPEGKVEEFSIADNHPNPKTTEKYFAISHRYGDPSCIILAFGDNYSDFSKPGQYTVKVSGLVSRASGENVSLSYKIDMFNTSDYVGKTPVTDEQYSMIEDFVERMYMMTLGRSSDETGKLDWSMRLADREESGAQVAYGFVFSNEYQNKQTDNTEYLTMLYKVFLDRQPDDAGMTDWMDQLEHGVSRLYVFKGFAESAEFGAICENYGIDRGGISLTEGRDLNVGATMFVYRLYDLAMDRTPDLPGLNDWAGQIARGETSAEQVAKSFFFSEEFTNKAYKDEDYVKILYWTFLGREFDQAGLDDWTGKLENGESRERVLEGFSGSNEFGKIMASYGL